MVLLENHVEKKKRQTYNFFKFITISWILIKLRGIIFNKFFTNYFTNTYGAIDGQNKFGQFNYLIISSTFVSSLAYASASNSVSRHTVEYVENQKRLELANMIMTTFILMTAVFLVIFPFFSIFNYYSIQGFPISIPAILLFILIYGYLLLIQNMYLEYVLAERKSVSYLFLNVIGPILNLIFSLGFVLIIFVDVGELLIAFFLSLFIVIFIYTIYIFSQVGIGKFSLLELKNILKYSGPLLIVTILSPFFDYTNAFLLNFYFGGNLLAIYVIAQSIAGMMSIVINSISSSVSSLQMSLFDSKEFEILKSFIRKFLRIYLIIVIYGVLFLWQNARFFILLFSNETYLSEDTIIAIVILGSSYIFIKLLHITGQGPYFYKKTDIISKRYFYAVIIALIASIILTPTFGLIGVCFAILLHHVLRFLFVFPASQKLIKMPIDYSKLILLIFPTGLSLLLIFFIPTNSLLGEGILWILWSGVFIIVVFVLKLTSISEIKTILKNLVKN